MVDVGASRGTLGHDPNNPSGKRADKEEGVVKDYINLNSLTIDDWEKIAKKFAENKAKKEEAKVKEQGKN
jgi:hypothetical protein